jgi:hypothetical protein
MFNNNPRCCYCCGVIGRFEDSTIDHIIPLKLGGRESSGNYALACWKCNNRKADRLLCEAGMVLQRKPWESLRALPKHVEAALRGMYLSRSGREYPIENGQVRFDLPQKPKETPHAK